MTGNFCAVFASIAVRGAKDAYQHLVNIANMTVVDGVWTDMGQIFGENTRKNLKRMFS